MTMKANYGPEHKPKELEDLTSGSKRRLEEYYTKRLREEIDDYMQIDQELLLKYSMVILSNPPFNFDRDQMLIYLGNWRSIKRQTRQQDKYEKQRAFLDEKLAKYDLPQEFIEGLCYEERKEK